MSRHSHAWSYCELLLCSTYFGETSDHAPPVTSHREDMHFTATCHINSTTWRASKEEASLVFAHRGLYVVVCLERGRVVALAFRFLFT